jgi:hypothetical protein
MSVCALLGTNNHVGNELFRQMVNAKKCLYLHSSKRDKPSVSKGIVQAIRSLNPPGRFLQRDELTGLWYDIGDQKAREKTSQALREGAPEIRKTLNPGAAPASVSGVEIQLPSSEQFSSHMTPASDGTWTNSKRPSMPSCRPPTFSPNRAHDAAAFRRIPDLSSSLPPHQQGTSSDAQAIYQFLKAQQLQQVKATAADEVDRYTAEQNSAATGAVTARALRHSIGHVGTQHSLSRAELEALVEARHAASLGTGALQSQINSTSRVSNFASQIAAAAGISPSAASIALQLAARAGEYSAIEEERERIRAASRREREREQEFYSQRRPRIASGIDYAPSATPSIPASLGSTAWQDSHPRIGAVTHNRLPSVGLAGSRDNQVASNLVVASEVQNRIAIAEQLAQLSCRLSGVPKVTSGYGEDVQYTNADATLPRSKEDAGVLQSRSALFQDLGLMGVPLEEIQYALVKNFSLEELLRKAQNGLAAGKDIKLEKNSSISELRGKMYDNHKSHVSEVEDEVNEERSNRTVWNTIMSRECIGETEASPAHERPAPQGASCDSVFPRHMVEYALNSMGVELGAS